MEIFDLNLQNIVNKLKPLAEIKLESKSVVILDEYDNHTKEFLNFILETIDAAKEAKFGSYQILVEKINRLINDSDNVLSQFFENNSLLSYYNNVLKDTVAKIAKSAKKTKEAFDAENLKTIIIDAIKSIYAESFSKKQKEINSIVESFKTEFVKSFKSEIEQKIGTISSEIEKQVKTEVEKNKDKISKEVNDATKNLLYKTVPSYMKTLNSEFNSLFSQYIERNLTGKANHLAVLSKLKTAYGCIITPFVYTAKLLKSAKDGVMWLGGKVKSKVSGPLSNLRDRIVNGFHEGMETLRLGFLKRTRFLRRPKKMFQLFLGRVKKKLESSSNVDTIRKFGLVGGLIGILGKAIIKAIRSKNKKYVLLGQMDFKPFKFLSPITNTIDEFIDSVSSHTNIVLSNLKIYFSDNVVEGYGTGEKSKLTNNKKKFKKAKSEKDGGFNLMEFFTSFPGMISAVKRIWRIIKKIGGFLKRTMKFVLKVGKSLVKHTVHFLGRAIEKIAIKTGWRGGIKLGSKLRHWKKAPRSLGKTVKGFKGLKTSLTKLKPSNLKAAGKGIGKMFSKGGSKLMGKVGAKLAGKSAAKLAGGALLAFAMDGAMAAMEARDNDAMAQVFGMKVEEIGAQQRTSYIIAGTLAGGSSLLDADWSSPASIGMAALDTGMTMAKWASAGAALGTIIPGVGNVVGALVGAGLGLAFSLIGTQRLAKAINWVCDASKKVWKYLKWTPIGILGMGLFHAGKLAWKVGKAAWKATKAIGKGIWSGIKAIGRGIAWLGKESMAIGKALWKSTKLAWKAVTHPWETANAVGKKLVSAVSKISGKIASGFSFLKNKAKEKTKRVAILAYGKINRIGNKLKSSIISIGKTLMSKVFPYSPTGLLVAGVKKMLGGLRRLFFGKTDAEKQLDDLKANVAKINTVSLDTFSSAVKLKLDNFTFIDNNGDEVASIDGQAQEDISGIKELSLMVGELFGDAPEIVPVPVNKEEEKSLTTIAADYWEQNDMPIPTIG